MAGRTFGQSAPAAAAASNVSKEDNAPNVQLGTMAKINWLVVGIALFAAIAVLVGTYFVITVSLDGHNGAVMPDEAAIGFVNALDDNTDDIMYSYVPRQIRGKQYVADTMNISDIKKLNDTYGVVLSNFVIISSNDLNDKISSLKDGLYSVYGKSVNICGAECVRMTADMRYLIDGEEQNSDLEFNIICIKVNTKWYVYTGQAISENSTNTVRFIETASVNKTVYDIVTEYVKPIVKTIKPLDFYGNALSDLQSGKVEINGNTYTMPSPYSEMTGLYTIAESYLTDATRVVKQNYILKHLPIEFVDNRYAKTDFDISIGNTTDDIIDVTDGTVTTLYVGLPENIYDYPDVYLPGNVTLGTSYADVVKMYGRLDRYEPNDNLNRHDDYFNIYQLPLNNKRNIIYFEFDSNEKLIAIQYYYFDLNGAIDNPTI